MRVREAAAFVTEYIQGEKGLKARRVLKPKSKAFGGGGGQNIRPAIPGGVTMTTINPTDNPKAWRKLLDHEIWLTSGGQIRSLAHAKRLGHDLPNHKTRLGNLKKDKKEDEEE